MVKDYIKEMFSFDIFVDPENIRLPIEGTVSMRCGLVQGEEAESCAYCGGHMNKRLQ